MSVLNYLVDKLKSGIITFINMVTLANHDYPYHDYATYADTEEPVTYTVGQNNKEASGDQHKLFVSKSTLIHATGACTIQLNNANNVTIDILADAWYTFRTNIKQIMILTIAADKNIYIYCEGVLPEETRSPL